MILAEAARCHLLLIDFQARLMPAIAEGEAVLANAVRLAEAAAATITATSARMSMAFM